MRVMPMLYSLTERPAKQINAPWFPAHSLVLRLSVSAHSLVPCYGSVMQQKLLLKGNMPGPFEPEQHRLRAEVGQCGSVRVDFCVALFACLLTFGASRLSNDARALIASGNAHLLGLARNKIDGVLQASFAMLIAGVGGKLASPCGSAAAVEGTGQGGAAATTLVAAECPQCAHLSLLTWACVGLGLVWLNHVTNLRSLLVVGEINSVGGGDTFGVYGGDGGAGSSGATPAAPPPVTSVVVVAAPGTEEGRGLLQQAAVNSKYDDAVLRRGTPPEL